MSDKTRHLHRGGRAPQGHLSNWALALVVGGLTAFALFLQRLL
jgi:hypothetical protein